MNSATLPDGDRFLKLLEVAQALRRSVKTVRRLIEAGELASVKIRGARLVRASAVEAMVQALECRP